MKRFAWAAFGYTVISCMWLLMFWCAAQVQP